MSHVRDEFTFTVTQYRDLILMGFCGVDQILDIVRKLFALIDTMVDLERDVVIAFMVALETLGKFAEGFAREMSDGKTQEEGDTADRDDKEQDPL